MVNKEIEEDYQAEDDARMLLKYQEIMKDKKRMEKAKAELKSKMEEIESTMECCEEVEEWDIL